MPHIHEPSAPSIETTNTRQLNGPCNEAVKPQIKFTGRTAFIMCKTYYYIHRCGDWRGDGQRCENLCANSALTKNDGAPVMITERMCQTAKELGIHRCPTGGPQPDYQLRNDRRNRFCIGCHIARLEIELRENERKESERRAEERRAEGSRAQVSRAEESRAHIRRAYEDHGVEVEDEADHLPHGK